MIAHALVGDMRINIIDRNRIPIMIILVGRVKRQSGQSRKCIVDRATIDSKEQSKKSPQAKEEEKEADSVQRQHRARMAVGGSWRRG